VSGPGQELPDLWFVYQGDPEWEAMWGRVNDLYPDMLCEDPETGEVWQYMGSSRRPEAAHNGSTSLYLHSFRHRALPLELHHPYDRAHVVRIRNRRKYLRFQSTPGWTPPRASVEPRAPEEV
jgi:hypothetical protein